MRIAIHSLRLGVALMVVGVALPLGCLPEPKGYHRGAGLLTPKAQSYTIKTRSDTATTVAYFVATNALVTDGTFGGNGSEENPFFGDISAAMDLYSSNAVFILKPSRSYQMTNLVLGQNITLIGQGGSNAVHITISHSSFDAGPSTNQFNAVWIVGGDRVVGITFDAGGATNQIYKTVGLNGHGNDIVIDGCLVLNAHGSTNISNGESWAIICSGRNNKILNCSVDSLLGSYCNGIGINGYDGLVENWRANGLTNSTGVGLSCNFSTNMVFRHGIADTFRFGIYWDTGNHQNILIDDAVTTNCNFGMYVSETNHKVEGITVKNCYFGIATNAPIVGSTSAAIRFKNGTTSTNYLFSDINIINNHASFDGNYPGSSNVRAVDLSGGAGFNIRGVRIVGNTFDSHFSTFTNYLNATNLVHRLNVDQGGKSIDGSAEAD